LREKGREALASCPTDLVFGVVVSIAGCFRGRRVTGSALSLLGCREPGAFTVHLQDMDMMGEAIEQRAREPLRSEDRGPFIEWQVAGHQRGAAFIALAEHLEEQFRTDRRERHVAHFVDDQQLDHVEMLLQRAQAAHYWLTARMRELELQFEQRASELRVTFVQEVEAITAEAAE
jgi:hypothetical protein